MKPWTKQRQLAAAFKNEGIRIGERDIGNSVKLRGIYAARNFEPGDYVASFHGKLIDRESFFKLALVEGDKARFDFINDYAAQVTLNSRVYHLYPENVDALGGHLINHSCGPNACFAQFERNVMFIRATRRILEGQEITIHYGWTGIRAAYEKKWTTCACQADYCAGSIELHVELIKIEDDIEGPYLSVEEVTKRFLADIVNDVDDHEAMLLRYAQDSTTMVLGAEVLRDIDWSAYKDKLNEGANRAIVIVATVRRGGIKLKTDRRLIQIIRNYT